MTTTAGPYYAGTLVRMASYGGTILVPTLGFRDLSGILVDPSTVQISYQDPTMGAKTTITYPAGGVIKDAVGLYHLDVDTTGKPGLWRYEWISPNQILTPQWFQVLLPPI